MDLTSSLHLRSVSIIEAAVADVVASTLLRNGSGRPLLELRIVLYDSQGENTTSIGDAIDRFASVPDSIGVIGGIFSDETATMLRATSAYTFPVVSPSATATWLAQSFFQRVVQPDSAQSQRLAELTSRLGWKYLTIVYDDLDTYASSMYAEFVSTVHQQGTVTCPAGGVTTAAASRDTITLGDVVVQQCHSRVIVLLANEYAACTTLLSAVTQGLTAVGYVWVGPDGFIASPLSCGDRTGVAINASVGTLGTAPGRGDSMSLQDTIYTTTRHNISRVVVDYSASDASVIDGVNCWRLGQTDASLRSQVSYSDGGGACCEGDSSNLINDSKMRVSLYSLRRGVGICTRNCSDGGRKAGPDSARVNAIRCVLRVMSS